MSLTTVVDASAGANSQVSFRDLCVSAGINQSLMLELIECDVATPVAGEGPQEGPHEWQFSLATIGDVKKAARLHRDLAVNWEGTAFALSLLEEIEELRRENKRLKQQLQGGHWMN